MRDGPAGTSAIWSARLIALSGIGLVGYAVVFLFANFTSFVELGLGPSETGATSEQVMAFSPKFHDYVSHLQAALAGFIAAVGVALVVFAMWGIRRGARWAFWGAVATGVVAVAVALPLHYPYGFATVGHLGVIYLDLLFFGAGFVLGIRSLRPQT